jgi:hypothetical protein
LGLHGRPEVPMHEAGGRAAALPSFCHPLRAGDDPPPWSVMCDALPPAPLAPRTAESRRLCDARAPERCRVAGIRAGDHAASGFREGVAPASRLRAGHSLLGCTATSGQPGAAALRRMREPAGGDQAARRRAPSSVARAPFVSAAPLLLRWSGSAAGGSRGCCARNCAGASAATVTGAAWLLARQLSSQRCGRDARATGSRSTSPPSRPSALGVLTVAGRRSAAPAGRPCRWRGPARRRPAPRGSGRTGTSCR